ncbi:phosphatidylethanolamine-binding protein, partial [Aphelenchoides avenae]
MRFVAAFVALASALTFVEASDNRTASAFIRYKIVPDIITTPPQNQLYARFSSGAQVRLGNSLSPGQ